MLMIAVLFLGLLAQANVQDPIVGDEQEPENEQNPDDTSNTAVNSEEAIPTSQEASTGEETSTDNAGIVTEEQMSPQPTTDLPTTDLPATDPPATNPITEPPKTLPPVLPPTQPPRRTNRPPTTTRQPEVVTQRPEVVTEKPEVVTEKPEIVTEKPEIVTEKPEEVRTDVTITDGKDLSDLSLILLVSAAAVLVAVTLFALIYCCVHRSGDAPIAIQPPRRLSKKHAHNYSEKPEAMTNSAVIAAERVKVWTDFNDEMDKMIQTRRDNDDGKHKKGWKEQKHHAWKGCNDVKHYKANRKNGRKYDDRKEKVWKGHNDVKQTKGWKSEKKIHHDLDAKSKHKSRCRKYEVSLPPSLDSNFNLASGNLSRSMQSETSSPLGIYVWKGFGFTKSPGKSKISSRKLETKSSEKETSLCKHGTISSENSKRSPHATKTISTYVRPENTRTSTRRCGPSTKSEARSSGIDFKLLDSSSDLRKAKEEMAEKRASLRKLEEKMVAKKESLRKLEKSLGKSKISSRKLETKSSEKKTSLSKHGQKSSENTKRISHDTKTKSTDVTPENPRTSTQTRGQSELMHSMVQTYLRFRRETKRHQYPHFVNCSINIYDGIRRAK